MNPHEISKAEVFANTDVEVTTSFQPVETVVVAESTPRSENDLACGAITPQRDRMIASAPLWYLERQDTESFINNEKSSSGPIFRFFRTIPDFFGYWGDLIVRGIVVGADDLYSSRNRKGEILKQIFLIPTKIVLGTILGWLPAVIFTFMRAFDSEGKYQPIKFSTTFKALFQKRDYHRF